MFAVAREREENRVSLSLFVNWVTFDTKRLQRDSCFACLFRLPAILLIKNAGNRAAF